MVRNRFSLLIISCLILTACGGKEKSVSNKDLFRGATNDAAKVAIVMKTSTPDSVARFICNTALGFNDGITIDTLQNAVLYAYENYKDDDLIKFSEEFDNYSTSLPLVHKMKILSLAALSDPDGLGYKLGLEYAIQIRDNKMTLADIDRDMNELEKACDKDSETFIRVLNGLSVALSMPEFANLPKPIIDKYGAAPQIKIIKTNISENSASADDDLQVVDNEITSPTSSTDTIL